MNILGFVNLNFFFSFSCSFYPNIVVFFLPEKMFGRIGILLLSCMEVGWEKT